MLYLTPASVSFKVDTMKSEINPYSPKHSEQQLSHTPSIFQQSLLNTENFVRKHIRDSKMILDLGTNLITNLARKIFWSHDDTDNSEQG